MNQVDRQLVHNAVECLQCGEVLISYHRHDYKTCSCPNQTMVDGGNDYQRYGGVDLDKVKTIQVFADDDFELVRQKAVRGARGKNGDQPLKYIPICQMTDEHLEAVIHYGGAPWHLEIISKELQYRKQHDISIKEN